MSYNNFTDADAAWRAAFDHQEICVAIIKHANPCGIAISRVGGRCAPQGARRDPLSAFGGVIAANTEITCEMAERVADYLHRGDHRAGLCRGRRGDPGPQKNIRVLVAAEPTIGGVEIRQISGGLLMQERDEINARATIRPVDPRRRRGRNNERRWPISRSPGAAAAR